MITRAVAFPTPATTLNGFLALPDGDGPHAGVVVIHGFFAEHLRPSAAAA